MAIEGEEGYSATLASVQAAYERIKEFVRETPVLHDPDFNSMINLDPSQNLYCKAECLQIGGSFKIRGATNAIRNLEPSVASLGVVAHSSGNHAAALALAARKCGVPATIVIPHTTPPCKRKLAENANAKIVLCEPTMEAREANANAAVQAMGGTLISPYNHPDIISGQGTIFLEFMRQLKAQSVELDAIVVPVSGGGMISGIAVAAKALIPSIKVIAAEPVGTNGVADIAAAKRENRIVECPKTLTIADGLQAKLGSMTWPIVRDYVDEVITVEEHEIVTSMRKILSGLRVVVEPSAAVGVAAISQKPSILAECRNIGVVLCGGNLDLDRISEYFSMAQDTTNGD